MVQRSNTTTQLLLVSKGLVLKTWKRDQQTTVPRQLVLLKQNTSNHLHIVYGCFHAIMADLTSCNRLYSLNIYHMPFIESLPTPNLKKISQKEITDILIGGIKPLCFSLGIKIGPYMPYFSVPKFYPFCQMTHSTTHFTKIINAKHCQDIKFKFEGKY